MADIATQVTSTIRSLALAAGMVLLVSSPCWAGPFDELSKERWSKLREAEFYQLTQADKVYKTNNFKAAADEYEKFVKLYQDSEGAPFAQLMWSHCQVQQRLLNTAIRDGYQTVIDYFPDSPEAVSAAYLIGQTYKNMGDLKAAKKAYAKVLENHAQHVVAILTRRDLVDIAREEKDEGKRLQLLKELTFDADRKNPAVRAACNDAANELTRHHFAQGDFPEGFKALATSFTEAQLPTYLMHPNWGALPNFVGGMTGQADPAVKEKGLKLADAGIAWMNEQVAADLKDEKTRPRAVQCWFCVADLHAAARRPDKQRKVYEQMMKTLGASDSLLGQIAAWYKVNGKRYDEARKVYLRYQDDKEGQRQIAYSYREEGKPDQAIAIYRELSNTDPDRVSTYNWHIAETLYGAGRWKDALQAYRVTENQPTSYFRMAECNRQLKQYGEAMILLEHIATSYATTSAGEAARALWLKGQVQEEAGQTEGAIATFKRVCDRFPKESFASNAHNHLNVKYKIRVTLGGAKE